MEFLPGKDGLVHISELANFRVKQTEDILKLGDEIWVKCLGVDEKGRVRLSRKAAMAERDKEMGGSGEQAPAGNPDQPAEPAGPPNDRPERRERREERRDPGERRNRPADRPRP